MAKIQLKGLSHTYLPKESQNLADPHSEFALRELDHVWQQGGAYALLGPSGCGKSTLLNIISGLVAPSHGEVLFDDKVVNQLSVQERNIAQVFQFPVVYDSMTVFDNLAFPLKNMGMPKDQIERKVSEVAALLELSDSLTRKASNLSADDKQKVSMARGLVREDVSAILFDEPLTVIDPNLKWKLRRKLKQIHEQCNITMLYVTHDQLEAATFADEIAVMYQGKIVQFGTPQALFDEPAHTFVGYFIGSPGMNFIPLQKRQNEYCYRDQVLPLAQQHQRALQCCTSNNLKLGIRPEFVCLTEQAGASGLPVTVTLVEQLGSYQLVTAYLEDLAIKIRVPEEQQVNEGSAFVSFPSDKLKLYMDEYLVALDGKHKHD